jgi:Flp pilus assembly pilin Flp
MFSTFNTVSTRAFVTAFNRLPKKDETGQATSEYGVVILVAIALAMAVAMLFVSGKFDGLLGGLVEKALSTATGMIKKP